MSELVSFEQKNGHYFLSGKLDRDSVPLFWQTKKDWMPRDTNVVIDLVELKRIDSAGMAMLLHLQKLILDEKRSVTFLNLPSQLTMLMQLSNIENFLNQ